MKTAVCISGKISHLDFHDNIRNHVINPYQADVFIESWWDNNPPIEELVRRYQPRLMNLEQFEGSPHTVMIRNNLPTNKKDYAGTDAPETKVENVLFMWYKIYKCNELRKNFEKHTGIRYDCVIRLRFDNTYEHFPIIDPAKNTLYIPEKGDWRNGINDQLAIADSQTMDLYCDLYNQIHKLSAQGIGIHPESMLRKYLEMNNVRIERFTCELHLRGNKV